MSKHKEKVQIVQPRPTVEIWLPDGRVLSGPRGAAVETFLKVLPEWRHPPIMGAIINGELRELTYTIEMDARVKPVTMADADGARIYRRSLTFLLEAAFDDLYPELELYVDHSLSSGGFFCSLAPGFPMHRIDLSRLDGYMRKLISKDLPFERIKVPLDEAVEIFQRKGNLDKVRLLKYRQKDNLVLYRLGDHQDYHHGYLVPSTGYLRWFELTPLGNGFALRFPRRHDPKEILPLPESVSLLKIFRQYGDWLARLGVESVGHLNDTINANRAAELILVSEALHEQQIAEIAHQIVEHKKARVILIAGPSSSGKTTFSKRLTIQLLAQGVSPYPIELDNYFVNREDTPLDENGDYDFEVLEALDTVKLNKHMREIIDGKDVQLPQFDFKLGKSEPGKWMSLKSDQIVILEGIHGLNPHLLPDLPAESTFRIYVSSLTQLNLDRHNRISTTDTRLLRRIVRDARERGYSAQQTIHRWESVRRGEKRHIFPYQDNANAIFNSALVYEVAALKPFAEPLLRQVPYGTPEYIEAKRLLAFLEWFLPLNANLIPDNSILLEFIGGSILKEFKHWQDTD